jgi:NADH-quinone oxidoreductase subunit E
MEIPAWQKEIDKILRQDGNTRAILLPCLETVNETEGYICPHAIDYLEQKLGILQADIYGVISFYGLLSVKKHGKYVIKICDSLSCQVNHDKKLLQTLTDKLGVQPGETTADGKYTLEKVPCLGLCDQSPVMLINETVYGNLSLPKLNGILAGIA